MFRQMRIFCGGCNVHGVVNLLDEDLHWLIHIVIGAHRLVIVLKTPVRNFCIRKVKVRQHLLVSNIGVYNVFFLEVLHVGFIDAGNEKGLEGLVRHVILGIKVRVDVIVPANVCDVCCCQVLRNERR